MYMHMYYMVLICVNIADQIRPMCANNDIFFIKKNNANKNAGQYTLLVTMIIQYVFETKQTVFLYHINYEDDMSGDLMVMYPSYYEFDWNCWTFKIFVHVYNVLGEVMCLFVFSSQ